jgi:hypothetical protein
MAIAPPPEIFAVVIVPDALLLPLGQVFVVREVLLALVRAHGF